MDSHEGLDVEGLDVEGFIFSSDDEDKSVLGSSMEGKQVAPEKTSEGKLVPEQASMVSPATHESLSNPQHGMLPSTESEMEVCAGDNRQHVPVPTMVPSASASASTSTSASANVTPSASEAANSLASLVSLKASCPLGCGCQSQLHRSKGGKVNRKNWGEWFREFKNCPVVTDVLTTTAANSLDFFRKAKWKQFRHWVDGRLNPPGGHRDIVRKGVELWKTYQAHYERLYQHVRTSAGPVPNQTMVDSESKQKLHTVELILNERDPSIVERSVGYLCATFRFKLGCDVKVTAAKGGATQEPELRFTESRVLVAKVRLTHKADAIQSSDVALALDLLKGDPQNGIAGWKMV